MHHREPSNSKHPLLRKRSSIGEDLYGGVRAIANFLLLVLCILLFIYLLQEILIAEGYNYVIFPARNLVKTFMR